MLSQGVLRRIAESLLLSEDDILVEIGGGTGNLTKILLEYPLEKLYVLEIDTQMVEKLKVIKNKKLKVIQADATRFRFCSLGKRLKVTGNLPYNVASLIVENTVINKDCITLGVFMLQKEVALKLAGKSKVSWLTLLLNTFYETEYLMSIPPRFFTPKPKVESGLIRIRRKYNAPALNIPEFKKFLTTLFCARRKMLKKKIPENILKKAGIDPSLRVEQISAEEIIRLYNVYEELR